MSEKKSIFREEFLEESIWENASTALILIGCISC